jgi:hypothetical protein
LPKILLIRADASSNASPRSPEWGKAINHIACSRQLGSAHTPQMRRLAGPSHTHNAARSTRRCGSHSQHSGGISAFGGVPGMQRLLVWLRPNSGSTCGRCKINLGTAPKDTVH